jgi:DNA primase small subunit
MKEQDIRFLRSVFAEYYSNHSEAVYVPPPVNSREIGFAVWPDRAMVRHMSFRSLTDVREYVLNNTPADAYHSCAVYEFPEKPMEHKRALWADLAFDVDAKDVQPDCVEEMTYSVCPKCGSHRRGNKKKCPNCSEESRTVEFMSFRCIASTAHQAKRLHSALIEELGIEEKDIAVYFSGHMGFHVYVTSKAIGELGPDARREITSYLSLEGAMDSYSPGKSANLRTIRAGGIGRRLQEEILDVVNNASQHGDILEDDGVSLLKDNKQRILLALNKGKIEDIVVLLGIKRARKLLRRAWQRAAIVVDPSVTMDIHRVFRMPGTLNSKSGLPKQRVPLDKIDANVLSLIPEYGRSEVQVSVSFAPEVEIGDRKVGPFSNETASVPRYIAAYLILKGVASVG